MSGNEGEITVSCVRDRRVRPAVAGLLIVACLLITGCGTRTPMAEIVAAEGGGAAGAGPDVVGQPAAAPAAVSAPAAGAAPTAGPAQPGRGTAGRTGAGARSAAGTAAAPAPRAAPVTVAAATTSCAKPLEPVKVGQVGGWTGIVGNILMPSRLATLSLAVGSSVAPWTEAVTDAQKRYHQAFATYGSGAVVNGASNVSWVSGELLARAIANLGAVAAQPITKELVLRGLGTIKKETLGGLTLPLSFTPNQKAAGPIPCFFPVLLTEQGWRAPQGNTYTCFRS
jgi:hypothetical protein